MPSGGTEWLSRAIRIEPEEGSPHGGSGEAGRENGSEGGLAERSNAPHSKCGWGEIPSEVRILHPPPINEKIRLHLEKFQERSRSSGLRFRGGRADVQGRGHIRRRGQLPYPRLHAPSFHRFRHAGRSHGFGESDPALFERPRKGCLLSAFRHLGVARYFSGRHNRGFSLELNFQ